MGHLMRKLVFSLEIPPQNDLFLMTVWQEVVSSLKIAVLEECNSYL